MWAETPRLATTPPFPDGYHALFGHGKVHVFIQNMQESCASCHMGDYVWLLCALHSG